jgi:hypothetical protein
MPQNQVPQNQVPQNQVPQNTRHKVRRGRSLTLKNKTLRVPNIRSRSLRPSKKINAKEIGSGGFGIVSRPPPKCKSFFNNNNNQNMFKEAYYGNPNYVSKLTEYLSAKNELDISEIIKNKIPYIDNDTPYYAYYFCLTEFICEAPDSKKKIIERDEYDTYAIAPYCGIPLKVYLEQNTKVPLKNYLMENKNALIVSVTELCNLVPALQYLINGIQRLHRNKIFHKDIHDENVLYDKDTGLLRLIDFGLAEYLPEYSIDSTTILSNEYHDLLYLVKNIIVKLLKFLLSSRISEISTRLKYPYVENFYYQIKDFNRSINTHLNPRRKIAWNRLETSDRLEQVTRLLNVIHYFKELKPLNFYKMNYYNAFNE